MLLWEGSPKLVLPSMNKVNSVYPRDFQVYSVNGSRTERKRALQKSGGAQIMATRPPPLSRGSGSGCAS